MKLLLQKIFVMMIFLLLVQMAVRHVIIESSITVVHFMFPHRDWFSTYEIVATSKVVMENNT